MGVMWHQKLGLGEAKCNDPGGPICAGVVPGLSRGCPACVKTRKMGFACSPGEQGKLIFRVLAQALALPFRGGSVLGVVPGCPGCPGCPVVVPVNPM